MLRLQDSQVSKNELKHSGRAQISQPNGPRFIPILFQEFETDPLFKKTSAQFDSGGGGGKFLCNLLTRDDCCQMLLDSEAIQVRK